MPVSPSENPRCFVSVAKNEPVIKVAIKCSSAASAVYKLQLRRSVLLSYSIKIHLLNGIVAQSGQDFNETSYETFSYFVDCRAKALYNDLGDAF